MEDERRRALLLQADSVTMKTKNEEATMKEQTKDRPTFTAVQTGDPEWPVEMALEPGWRVCSLCKGAGMTEEPGCKADPATGWPAEEPYLEQCHCQQGYVKEASPCL